VDRAAERDLLPMARTLDIAVTPWSVLGAGVLTGKYNADPKSDGRVAKWGTAERDLKIAQEVTNVAKTIGALPSQVAIAWVLQQQHPNHAPIIPILGARKADQLKDNLGALDLKLSTDHLAQLSEVSKIELGFPHEFLTSDGVLEVVFGGTYNLIDNHRR
jgi:aryl-alcohol dehydrogenase-like predicted oxidoreductase